jgi:hypothetical protein
MIIRLLRRLFTSTKPSTKDTNTLNDLTSTGMRKLSADELQKIGSSAYTYGELGLNRKGKVVNMNQDRKELYLLQLKQLLEESNS